MKRNWFDIGRKIHVLVLSLSLLVFASCGVGVWPQDVLDEAYQKSLVDTQDVEPDEISTSLEAITDYNPDVTWEGEPGKSRILVSTWTTWNGYEKQIGNGLWATSREIWVFLPTEMTRWIRSHRFELLGDARTLRLQELLGMPPKQDEERWFAELWADPNDIFRPSPDPEITDSEAELTFPQSDKYVTVSADHIKWFDDLLAISYTSSTAHPWTRLGYTYDWAIGSKDHIGVSEFVVRKDAVIEVDGVWTTADYGK